MRMLRSAALGAACTVAACLAGAGVAMAQEPQFERVQLVDDSQTPFELDVASDGRVFYIERFGGLRVWDPDTEDTTTIGTIPVYSGEENGLLGLALAPDFDQSEQLYLHYSVAPEATLTQRVSRFTLNASGQLDMASEEVVYEFQHQRDECCHTAGSLEFGPDGSLYISTGDNVNPFQSDGYAPIDERPGREAFDAQRTSANTNDPNGKILRIVPNAGEPGYTIPEGNLFEPGTSQTLPEIYAMGFRNPFRFTVDPETGWVLLGDYGPDAGGANPNRGPQGSVEYNVITEPGFYGWPYCVRENVPYIDYDFATGTSGLPFDCSNPVNTSPNNTGLTELPPAKPATMWMGYSDTDDRVPNLGTGGAPMGGPRYHFDPENPAENKFPESFDGEWFISEWNQSWIKTATLDSAGAATDVSDFPGLGYRRTMDMTFGPDGALYVAEYGLNSGGNNDDSGIYRIDYVGELECDPEPPDPDDEFDGTELDPCRWSEIVRSNPEQLAVRDGALAIDTGNNTDMFGGNTTAENIVLQPAPEGAWEITTEVTMPFTGKDYEQAGLMVHGGDADWAKLMFIKVPENDGRQVEFTLQDNGSASFDPALDRSAFLPASFPDTIHLRIRSDGTSLTAAYSEDGTEWTDVGRVRPAGAIPDPRIGVAAFNGDGSGNEAEFDYFHVDPLDVEPTCTEPEAPDPGYEMLFDGTAESASQWQMAGPGGFNLTAQCTLESFGGLGMLYRDDLYQDPVTFRLDWMIPGDDNSGVVVGNWEPDPDYPSGPAWDALDNGYEIQIDATDDLDSTTGALYNIRAPDQALRDEALNPPGEWNTFEITVDDPEIIVRLNGVMINHYVHDPGTYPNRDISATKLGIQNHGPGDTIFYRRIQVRLGQVNNPPVIESIAADPSSGDAPLEVDLSVTASDPDGDELSYEWDFGDGETSTEEDPTHTYNDPGTYEAEVTVSDGEAEVSDSATVTVDDGPVGEPDLGIQAPSLVKVKPRQKLAKLRFRARNEGDAASGPVRLCVRAPKGKLALKGKKCTTTDIPAGEVRQRQVKLRVKPKARGKTTKVKLTAAGPNVDNQTKVVRVRAGR